jgi:hypothetical protein
MGDFSDAAFSPEVIERAVDQAVATLPEPVSSAHVSMLAEVILSCERGRAGSPGAAATGATRTATRAAGLNRRGDIRLKPERSAIQQINPS